MLTDNRAALAILALIAMALIFGPVFAGQPSQAVTNLLSVAVGSLATFLTRTGGNGPQNPQ